MTLVENANVAPRSNRTRREMPPSSAAELLLRLRRRRPDETRDQLEERFLVLMRDYENIIDEIGRLYFRLNFNTLTKPAPTKESLAEKKRAAAELTERTALAMKSEMVKVVLLDIVLPSGKPLRASTGKECANAGGWFKKIAGQVKPNEIVGKVLSEAQLRKLYVH